MPVRARLSLVVAALCFSGLLGGCSSLLSETTSAGAGVAAAGISRGITDNAGVVTGIGLGVQAAARAGLQYTQRKVHQAAQDHIAAVAGELPAGGVARWKVVHDLPIEDDGEGQVTVSRAFGGTGFACKEIVFSVEHARREGVTREFYTATVCRDGPTWKWATAEPATERWGSLQ